MVSRNPIIHKRLLYVGDSKLPVKVYVSKSFVDVFKSIGMALDIADRTVEEGVIDDSDEPYEFAIAFVDTMGDIRDGYKDTVAVFAAYDTSHIDGPFYDPLVFENGYLCDLPISGDELLIWSAEERLRR